MHERLPFNLQASYDYVENKTAKNDKIYAPRRKEYSLSGFTLYCLSKRQPSSAIVPLH